MNKKILFILFLFLFIFCSCSINDAYDPDVNVKIATLDELKSSGGVTIKVAYGNLNYLYGPGLKDLIAQFTKDYSEYNINVIIDEQSKITIKNHIIDGMKNNNAPTIAFGYSHEIVEYLHNSGIVSLNPYIKSNEVGIWDNSKNTFNEDYDLYSDLLVENQQFNINNRFYSLPFNKTTEVLIYNKTAFDTLNLDVPKTWSEVESVSKSIIDKINSGVVEKKLKINLKTMLDSGKFYTLLYDSSYFSFLTAVQQWGGTFVEHTYDKNGDAILTSPVKKFNSQESVEAMRFFQNLAKNKYFNFPHVFNEFYSSYPFMATKCLMTIASSDSFTYLHSRNLKYDIAPVPYNSNTGNKSVIVNGHNICMFSNASDVERLAGWLLIKYLLSAKSSATFAIKTGYFPVNKASTDVSEYKEFLQSTNESERLVRLSLQTNELYRLNGYTYFTAPSWIGDDAVTTNCGEMMKNIVVSNENVESALSKAFNK